MPEPQLRRNDRGELDDHAGEDHADHRHQLDEDVQAGAGGVLERIADRVADDRGLVHRVLGAVGQLLAAVGALLDVLLGVVPGAAGVVERDGQDEAGRSGRRPAGP